MNWLEGHGNLHIEGLRPPSTLFVLIFIGGVWRRVGRQRRTVGCRSAIRFALEILGGLCGYLRNVQSDVLFLSAALPCNRDVIGSLDGVEDILTTLWLIQGGAVDGGHQVTGLQAQRPEYRAISSRINSKASQFSGRIVI